MITTPILTVNPNKDSDYAAEFKLYTEKWDFKANIGHSNDVMYNTLTACLSYLQTGAGAIAYSITTNSYEFSVHRFNVMIFNQKEGIYYTPEKTDTVYIKDNVYKLETNEINICDFCQNIIDCYYSNQEAWLDFCNSKDRKSPETIHSLIKEIHRLLPQKSKYVSVVRPRRTHNTDIMKAWTTGEYGEEPKVIAQIHDNKNVVYLDKDAKTDPYVQNILAHSTSWNGYPYSDCGWYPYLYSCL